MWLCKCLSPNGRISILLDIARSETTFTLPIGSSIPFSGAFVAVFLLPFDFYPAAGKAHLLCTVPGADEVMHVEVLVHRSIFLICLHLGFCCLTRHSHWNDDFLEVFAPLAVGQ